MAQKEEVPAADQMPKGNEKPIDEVRIPPAGFGGSTTNG